MASRPADDELLTVAQMAKNTPVGQGKLRELMHSGELEHVVIGGRYFATLAQWNDYVTRNTRRVKWEDETKGRASSGSTSVGVSTSVGQKAAGAASARRAQQIAEKLKSSSPNGSRTDKSNPAPVTHLRFS